MTAVCDFCGRPAVAKVRKKYPSKDRAPRLVCGYHIRPYRTSEFKREAIAKEIKRIRKLGYAPDELMGYAPTKENER